jgi:hypothetical protein
MKFGDAFASTLHERYMKPAGFKKKDHTFSRSRVGYDEHYNIQGSAWNSADGAWRFYVNCAISFPDIPIQKPGSGMWKYHAHTRLRMLVPGAPAEFDVTEQSQEEVMSALNGQLEKCADYFARRHQMLRESYLSQRYSGGFPDDPERKRG